MDIYKYFDRVNKRLNNMNKQEFVNLLQETGVDCNLKGVQMKINWEVYDGKYKSDRENCKYRNYDKCKHPDNEGKFLVDDRDCIKSNCPLAKCNRDKLLQKKYNKLNKIHDEIINLHNEGD